MKTTFLKSTALAVLAVLVAELFVPVAASALTSGPTQPEFSSFEPVATTGMVNEFTGAFTYNLPVISIPGANGGGYALSLSYHGGGSPEEEASWVGYGWTLNPGAITRGKRGFPDDYNGEEVRFWNKMEKNWTASVQAYTNLEVLSADLELGMKTNLRYNNYTGFSYVTGVSAHVKGIANLTYAVSDGQNRSFSVAISPSFILDNLKQLNMGIAGETLFDAVTRENIHKTLDLVSNVSRNPTVAQYGSHYGITLMPPPQRATTTTERSGEAWNVTLALQALPAPFPAGMSVGLTGTYTYDENKPEDPLKAYGYMYLSQCAEIRSVMDYYVEKEAPYDERDHYLALPFGNADSYTIAGEGLTGGFRLHNTKAGHFRVNHKTSSKSMFQIPPELGFGSPASISIGGKLGIGYSLMTVGTWPVAEEGYTFNGGIEGEPVFFRFNNDLGGNVLFADNDEAVRADISGSQPSMNGTNLFSIMNSGRRSGRSSYISHTTNAEMLRQRNNVHYRSHTKGSVRNFVRRDNIPNGVGEIAVVNEDGNRYVYGLPVYSRREKNLQFGLLDHQPDIDDEYIAYARVSTASPTKAVIGEEREAPYATSYLLTEITTPDYIDRTNNGPTPDDFGGYTKFNYIRTAGTNDKVNGDASDWYNWRVPYNGLLYQRNKMSDPRDDMGSVAQGQKEIYYLQSVETKTHIAVFVTNKTDITLGDKTITGSLTERLDGYEALGDELESAGNRDARTADYDRNDYGARATQFLRQHGSMPSTEEYEPLTSATITSNKLRMLERIELYTTDAEGDPDKLMKTTHFEYDYSTMQTQPTGNSHLDTSWTKDKSHWMWVDNGDGIYDVRERTWVSDPPKMVIAHKYGLTPGLPNTARSVLVDPAFGPDGVHNVTTANYIISRAPYLDPNSVATDGDIDPIDDYRSLFPRGRYGKLTLKKVWFEYEGVVSARISPYVFGYNYKKSWDYAAPIQTTYWSVVGTNNNIGNENPHYDPLDIDRWGSYQYKGHLRHRMFNPWVDQSPDPAFDPAAWQLKWIRLPSGGEIHVQYEQHDYLYVQDRRAQAMVSIQGSDFNDGVGTYYMNASELGVNTSSQGEMQELAELIRTQYIAKREKMFFKFLYALVGTDANPYNCGSEYITGYGDIKSVDVEGPVSGQYRIKISFDDDNGEIPRDVCKNFVETFQMGRLDPSAACGPTPQTKTLQDNSGNESAVVKALLGLVSGILPVVLEESATYCYTINPSVSYLRVPVPRAKKGGGIRVKRILSYDRGLSADGGDAALYGSEYLYETIDERGKIVSSGVATNEPSTGREENSLVQFLPKRSEQMWHHKIIAGRDKEQFEGPIGETIMPGESIGYSRVVVRNIHGGPTGTGFVVNDFYTARDFPVIVKKTGIESDDPLPVFIIIPNVCEIVATDKHLSQGYSFILNNMHGQMKRTASYSGDYSAENPGSWVPVSYQEFEYFKPGETIPVMDGQSIQQEYPGKEMEVAFESREIRDESVDGDIEFDLTLSLIPPIFVLSIPSARTPYLAMLSAELHTHVTTKISRYPAIQKSVITYRDGVTERTEYLAFNPKTGKPAITRTYDGYHGLRLGGAVTPHKGMYNHISIPASQIYPDMGQKAHNERFIIKPNNVSVNTIGSETDITLHSVPIEALIQFSQGDLIEVRDGSAQSESFGLYHVTSVQADPVQFNIVLRCVPPRFSSAYIGTITEVEIIRSGRTNQLSAVAGTITQYGADIGGTFNPWSNVISSQITTYSDNWSYSGVTGGNIYEKGMRGKWRPKASYVYNAQTVGAVGAGERVYSGGIQVGGITSPWPNENALPPEWITTSTVTKYSKHGEAIEERDVLGIYSAAQYGYSGMLPVLTAKNATNGSVSFQSFEDATFSEQVPPVAHSGRKSLHIDNWGMGTVVQGMKWTQQFKDKGMSLKCWVKFDKDYVRTADAPHVVCNYDIGLANGSDPMTRIARAGEWHLYEKKFPAGLSHTVGTTMMMSVGTQGAAKELWVDDIRVQPLDAQMVCYVYDRRSFKLIASFDDQHFGLYYQYNGEGKLVRKLKETERGMKTVQEVQYHTPLIGRSEEGTYVVASGGSMDMVNPRRNGINYRHANKQLGDGGNFDIFDATLTPDKRKIKVFGTENLSFPDLNTTIAPDGTVLPTPDTASLRRQLKNTAPDMKMIPVPEIDSSIQKKVAPPDSTSVRRVIQSSKPRDIEVKKEHQSKKNSP